jgi:hypothetical protein
MTWKLIVFLVLFVLALLFTVSNLGNHSDVSIVWIYTLKDVPVFISMFFSLAFGIICMVPFLIRARSKGKKSGLKKAGGAAAPGAAGTGVPGAGSPPPAPPSR